MPNLPAITKWCEVLDGDNFEQCQGSLKQKEENGYSYCCLGVAAEIFGLGDTIEIVAQQDGELNSDTYNAVYSRLGLDGNQCNEFIRMNDHGDSFKAISAKVKERYLNVN